MVKVTPGNNGYFTVELLRKRGEPFVKITDCKIVHTDKGSFVSVPSRKYQDKDGKDKWHRYVWLDDDIQKEIIKAATPNNYVDESEIPF